jgi:hypothetical protein
VGGMRWFLLKAFELTLWSVLVIPFVIWLVIEYKNYQKEKNEEFWAKDRWLDEHHST